jgi:tetratricopeptide (TPR) repeat protein
MTAARMAAAEAASSPPGRHAGASAALFQAALRLHRQNRFAEAERLYQAILAGDSGHFGALHHLGVIRTQQSRLEEAAQLILDALEEEPDSPEAHNNFGIVRHGQRRFEEAISSYRTAIALRSDFAEAHNNLGNSFHALRRHDEAIGEYQAALAINPHYAEAMSNLGNALRESDRLDEAVTWYERALVLKPDYAKAQKNLGNALQLLGRYEDAVGHYEQALGLKPDFAEAHNDLANTLQMLDRHKEAIEHYSTAIALKPDYEKAHYNLGNALQAVSRHEDAIRHYDQAIALKPRYAKAHNNRGTALNALGRPREAIQCYRTALAIDPGFAGAYNNLGNALQALDLPEEAIALYKKAIAVTPDYAEAYSNLGHALHALNRHREAIEHYEISAAIKPSYPDAHWNEALARLSLGEFDIGWKKYEWRWRNRALNLQRRELAQPLWLGETEIAGKTILLHAEQGYGDALQFARYIPLVAQRGARVVLEVHKPLLPLLADCAGAAIVAARGEVLPAFDLHCPLLSLPLALGTRLETIPPPLTLSAPAAKIAQWRPLFERSGRPRIGLAWAGNPNHKNDRSRSVPLRQLRPLLDRADLRFLSLQKDLRSDDAEAIAGSPNLLSPGNAMGDFADTAALIHHLDLVITVDTAIAHLAGTLGKEVWILLPVTADWRWLIERRDSPWYPCARLFRQSKRGDWPGVIAEVAAELGQRFGS